MLDHWILGLASGAASSLLRPVLLMPIFRARGTPWKRPAGAQTALLIPPSIWTLLVLWGAAEGLLFATLDASIAPIYGSYVLQGLAVGGASFIVAAPLLAGWQGLLRILDRKVWIAILLTHLVVGATIGLVIGAWGPYGPA